MGWRRGCQAAAMVRADVHDYCLATCSPLLVFVRRPPHFSSLLGGGWCRFLSAPTRCCPSLASLAVCVAGCPVRVSLALTC